MRRITVLIIGCLVLNKVVGSELTLTGMCKVKLEDFNSFLGTYESMPTGFAVSKDGSILLCDTNTADFRGVHSGGTVEGACLAWNLSDGDHALGYQPTEDEFTPGFFLLAISNCTGQTIARLDVSYDVVFYNNEDRSSYLQLEYSSDGKTFTTIGSSHCTTPLEADIAPAWSNCCYLLHVVCSQAVSAGSCMWLRWYGDDNAGTGRRDEYGINNVTVTPRPVCGTVISVR
ncbi:MAG: hypothetical protein JXN60_00055 [Lentisphaerae bacterium]|nr:hypothetical protein [Lentisphaerota bacterium]